MRSVRLPSAGTSYRAGRLNSRKTAAPHRAPVPRLCATYRIGPRLADAQWGEHDWTGRTLPTGRRFRKGGSGQMSYASHISGVLRRTLVHPCPHPEVTAGPAGSTHSGGWRPRLISMRAGAPLNRHTTTTRPTRVHVVSDVHGNTEALARAGDGADALICLGDLVLFLDYADHSRGIFPDLFGTENADRIVELRTARRFEEARAFGRELWAGIGADRAAAIEKAVRKQYAEM